MLMGLLCERPLLCAGKSIEEEQAYSIPLRSSQPDGEKEFCSFRLQLRSEGRIQEHQIWSDHSQTTTLLITT